MISTKIPAGFKGINADPQLSKVIAVGTHDAHGLNLGWLYETAMQQTNEYKTKNWYLIDLTKTAID